MRSAGAVRHAVRRRVRSGVAIGVALAAVGVLGMMPGVAAATTSPSILGRAASPAGSASSRLHALSSATERRGEPGPLAPPSLSAYRPGPLGLQDARYPGDVAPKGGASTAGWQLEASPNGSMPNGELTAISCSSANDCTAVGYGVARSGDDTTVAERWNGSAWTLQTTPNPPGITNSYLYGVSCPSASACYAVGYYYSGSTGGAQALAEFWDGSSWTIQPTPNPAGAVDTFLEGVSCPSTARCFAAGYYYFEGSGDTLVESWDGTSWSIESTPNPYPNYDSNLYSISCASATSCEAAGSYLESDTSPTETLGERWDGESWSIQSTPNPADYDFSALYSVSCSSGSACTAVGIYSTTNTAYQALVERWDGSAWAIQTTAPPPNAQLPFLNAVSCTSARACVAVGSYGTTPLAESWNGTTWSIAPSPASVSIITTPTLLGLSCISVARCQTAGYYSYFEPVSEGWNGTAWSVEPTPQPAGASDSWLQAVSCTSANDCEAVGYVAPDAEEATLAERWNGTAWKMQATPNPSDARSYLFGVSCTSATFCEAVGYYINAPSKPLAEMWNGKSWTIQRTPQPSGALWSFLLAVSCTSATNCTAVGQYHTKTSNPTMSERWNGTAWTIEATPDPPSASYSYLLAVSCSSSDSCEAVGYDVTPAIVPLAEHWNGAKWQLQSVATLTAGSLRSVSCTSADACTAVGDVSDEEYPLAASWNGKAWSAESVPEANTIADLQSVSCTAADACTAVGSTPIPYSEIGGTLAETWDGTSWSVQSTPTRSGDPQNELIGVSCTASATCSAVGNVMTNTNLNVTLTEVETS
jgi:hypothetical protein